MTIIRRDGTVTITPAYDQAELRALVRVRGDVTPEKRAYVMRRDRGTCRYCGSDATEIDHVVPVALGGSGAVRNLVAACGDCNSRKGATVWKPKPLAVVLRMRT